MTTQEIGEKIRTMRESRKMTQKDLAIAINMSESAVAMYEAGKRRPKDVVAEALADVFNVPKWSIYYREDEMIPIQEYTDETGISDGNMLSPDEWKMLNGIRRMPTDKAKMIMNMVLAAVDESYD